MRVKTARKIVLTNLVNEFKKTAGLFEIVAIIGSHENDIDGVVILSKKNKEFVRKFYSLVRITQKIQRKLKAQKIFLSLFPTFRLEIFDKELSNKNLSNDKANFVQLHLLVYPTYDHFIEWEDPMIVKAISYVSEIVVGNNRKLRKIGKEIKNPSFKSRVGNLLSLLLENYRFLTCSLIDNDILLKEALHKTLYVARYAAFNFLLEQNCDMRNILTWEAINDNRYKIKDKRILGLFNKAFSWRKRRYIPTHNELLKFNDRILALLENWLIEKS